MDTRTTLDARAGGLMVVLCMIWGLQQVVLKAAMADVAPVLLIALRSGLAALLVAGLMRWQGEPISFAAWRPGLLAGLLFALEFLLVGEALRHTSASRTVVFLYTAPLFAALGLHWRVPAERLGRMQWLGIVVAFAGVAIAFLGGEASRSGGNPGRLLGDLLALLGGIAWGATTVVIRVSRLSTTPPTLALLYQLLAAFVFLLVAASGLGQDHFHPTALAWGSLVFQTLVVSFASFLAWFWLLRRYLASRLGVFSFLTPVFGVGFGAAFLGELLEMRFLGGAALVMAGILVVNAHAWLGSRLSRLSGHLASARR